MKKITFAVVAFFAAISLLVVSGCGGGDQSLVGSSSSSGGPTFPPLNPDDLLTDYEREQGDQFQLVGTHPFVVVTHDPLSTFGVDVDTASYDIFRRDLQNSNRLPQADSVRVEEYINYFDYGYPAPTLKDEQPFQISLSAAPHILDRATHLLRVGIQAAKPADIEKRPANLVFLIDRSGSMAGSDKLPLVQKLLIEALGILDPTDTVTLVTYASGTAVELEPTKVEDKATIVSAINDLSASGSTNGGEAIQLAYQQAHAGFIAGGINHVILCSDGDFNVGTTSNAALVALIEEQRKTGVTFTALGFGSGNLNDSMLEATSNAGNGTYAVISSERQALDYTNNRLLSNIAYVAKDMKVQVEFNPQLVSHYRLIGYENRDIKDDEFREDEVDAGEIGVGHRVTALYELVLKGGALPEPEDAPEPVDGDDYDGPLEVAGDDYVLVKVRYKEVDATAEDPAKEVSSSLKTLTSQLNAADADLRWAAAVAAFAEILKGSPFADSGYLEQIGAILAEQRTRDSDRAEFYQLFRLALPILGNAGG